MKSPDMEHMAMRWTAEYNRDEDSWDIVTETGGLPWYVASITMHLPGDESGERTAKAICEAHNAALVRNT